MQERYRVFGKMHCSCTCHDIHVYNLTDARVIDLSRVNHLKKETFLHSSINEGEKHTCTTATAREKSTNQTQQNNKTN